MWVMWVQNQPSSVCPIQTRDNAEEREREAVKQQRLFFENGDKGQKGRRRCGKSGGVAAVKVEQGGERILRVKKVDIFGGKLHDMAMLILGSAEVAQMKDLIL